MIYYSITTYYIILSHAWWKYQLLSHLRLSATPLLCPWNSPRQECWSVLPFPYARDHPNPGIEPGLLHCRWILYHLSHQGSARVWQRQIKNTANTPTRPADPPGFREDLVKVLILHSAPSNQPLYLYNVSLSQYQPPCQPRSP